MLKLSLEDVIKVYCSYKVKLKKWAVGGGGQGEINYTANQFKTPLFPTVQTIQPPL